MQACVANERFPDAIELLVRGLRSGLPVTETLAVVAQEIPGPVGEEFKLPGEVALKKENDRLQRLVKLNMLRFMPDEHNNSISLSRIKTCGKPLLASNE